MSESVDLVVSKLDSARRALVEAKTIQETKTILDVAAEVYARRQQLGEEAIGYALQQSQSWQSQCVYVPREIVVRALTLWQSSTFGNLR